MITVTTVIPVRNREKFIVRALESVSSQTFPSTEVIVVDDASTDETPHVVENLAKKLINLTLIRLTENVGAAKARNIGAEVAKGDLLAFLDSDDRWYPEKLEKQINEFRANRDIVAVCCGVLTTTKNSSSRFFPPANISLAEIYRSSDGWNFTSTGVISKKAFAQIGGFDTSLPSCQDWDLLIRLAEIGKIHAVQDELIEYCCHLGDRISNNKAALLAGYNPVFNKIYKRLSDVSDPILIRIMRGRHECILAEIFSSDEPHRALGHALKALALAPSGHKLHVFGQVAKLAVLREVQLLRKACVR
jgi:glycosyltransferase involved in cell wall biosynthesis